MKKTLLIAGLALAASVISSQAQVYSQNIVGYVNIAVTNGFYSICNTLDASGGNSATNLFDCTSGNNDGSELYTWTGTTFGKVVFASSSPTGFKNASGTANAPAPVLSTGQAFLFNNQNDPVVGGGVISNLTFVGTVHVEALATGSQTVGSTSNLISGSQQYVFISSKLPIGGGVTSVLNITNDAAGDLDGSVVLIPIIANGQIKGYNQTLFASSSPTGFKTGNGASTAPEPVIPVGAGFLFSNQSGQDWGWLQSF